jgi:hypothetical protein
MRRAEERDDRVATVERGLAGMKAHDDDAHRSTDDSTAAAVLIMIGRAGERLQHGTHTMHDVIVRDQRSHGRLSDETQLPPPPACSLTGGEAQKEVRTLSMRACISRITHAAVDMRNASSSPAGGPEPQVSVCMGAQGKAALTAPSPPGPCPPTCEKHVGLGSD